MTTLERTNFRVYCRWSKYAKFSVILSKNVKKTTQNSFLNIILFSSYISVPYLKMLYYAIHVTELHPNVSYTKHNKDTSPSIFVEIRDMFHHLTDFPMNYHHHHHLMPRVHLTGPSYLHLPPSLSTALQEPHGL